MAKGKLIAISGIDGVGKSAMVTRVHDKIRSFGIKAIMSYDPHPSCTASSVIRKLVKENKLSERIVLGLITCARAEVCEEIIVPSLNNGIHVITHRWLADSMAYQDRAMAKELHKILCDEIMPDCQIIMDAPVNICKQRIADRGNEYDIFDNENDEIFESWRSAFMWDLFTKNTHIVNADKPIDEVFENVWDIVSKSIGLDY